MGYERFLALHVILIVPGTSRGFFVLVEKFAGRETFLEKGFSPRAPPFQKLLPVSLRKDGKVHGAVGLAVTCGLVSGGAGAGGHRCGVAYRPLYLPFLLRHLAEAPFHRPCLVCGHGLRLARLL